ncbi:MULTISPECIES: hypothetical protein [Halobacterium]|uniref:hypothetical protein n=1 Tax=Halobacterium TaxID=2239 RepID=UPI00073EECC3|nr:MULTISPECIES: hypothetical protein [Halobacterium]MCG1002571.1 hypothetical protein [Halobacterium noricense]
MSDSPSSGDADAGNPHVPERGEPDTSPSPLAVGVTLWREGVVAFLGLVALLTGVHGFWFVLGGGFYDYQYEVWDLAGDLAYLLAGVFLLVVAVGSAATRLRVD